ncbi:MAG: response regulator transcription factor [Deltaproteobacteria bacterium]|nr:response regulator transcription factor [Deltaproteobacteria bacterium]
MNAPYCILLAEGHRLLRQEIIRIIEEIQGTKVVGAVGSGPELFEFLEIFIPDLLILDISLPRLRALEATREIRDRFPNLAVLILTLDRDGEYPDQALAAGAQGCLLKQDADLELPPAINALRQGRIFLSARLETNGEKKTSRLFLPRIPTGNNLPY